MHQGESKIQSLEEARRAFSTQRKCEKHLKKQRWPNGVECPRCGTKPVPYLASRHKWQCKSCRYQFSVTAQTIFHRSKIDLPRWFTAIWLICNSPKGISAKALERQLGVHYETAWYMAKRIRKAMKHDIFEDKLCGIVEVDSAVIKADGGQATGNVTYDAKDVLGITERGGLLKMVVLERLTKANIKRVIAENFGDVKQIYSDSCWKLRFLSEYGKHDYINHWLTFAEGDVHTNYVENAWSLFKRGLIGMYHHVSAQCLQEYLDEFAFRCSHRKEKAKMFDLVLANCEVAA